MICPKCSLGRPARDRHLQELRARPQGRAARRRGRATTAGPEARRRGRRPEDRPWPRCRHPVLDRRDLRRARLRGARRPRGDARQRPPPASLVAARVAAPQPAFAGVVTGSFVTERERAASIGLDTSPSPSPLSRVAVGLTFAAIRSSWRRRCCCAAILVGRGPWGNMFEFSVAFSTSMLGGYLFLAAALRHPLDRVHPARRRARDPALREHPAARDLEPLVPALQNPPLLTIHVGMAVHLVRHLRDELRGRRRATSPRARTTGSRGCRRTRCSTRSPIGRSSSASRSSRR